MTRRRMKFVKSQSRSSLSLPGLARIATSIMLKILCLGTNAFVVVMKSQITKQWFCHILVASIVNVKSMRAAVTVNVTCCAIQEAVLLAVSQFQCPAIVAKNHREYHVK